MIRQLLIVLPLAALLLAGCAGRKHPAGDESAPLTPGIKPLTVEQEEQVAQ